MSIVISLGKLVLLSDTFPPVMKFVYWNGSESWPFQSKEAARRELVEAKKKGLVVDEEFTYLMKKIDESKLPNRIEIAIDTN